MLVMWLAVYLKCKFNWVSCIFMLYLTTQLGKVPYFGTWSISLLRSEDRLELWCSRMLKLWDLGGWRIQKLLPFLHLSNFLSSTAQHTRDCHLAPLVSLPWQITNSHNWSPTSLQSQHSFFPSLIYSAVTVETEVQTRQTLSQLTWSLKSIYQINK